jgi:hypothetical protein
MPAMHLQAALKPCLLLSHQNKTFKNHENQISMNLSKQQ